MSGNEERCKASVWKGYFANNRCARKAWKDGYCKQHHPDSIKKRREESRRKFDEKQKQSPWYKLKMATERIAELEAQNKRLLEALKECLPYVKQALQNNLESLKDVDPDAQFYGADIVSAPIIWGAEKAIAEVEGE